MIGLEPKKPFEDGINFEFEENDLFVYVVNYL